MSKMKKLDPPSQEVIIEDADDVETQSFEEADYWQHLHKRENEVRSFEDEAS